MPWIHSDFVPGCLSADPQNAILWDMKLARQEIPLLVILGVLICNVALASVAPFPGSSSRYPRPFDCELLLCARAQEHSDSRFTLIFFDRNNKPILRREPKGSEYQTILQGEELGNLLGVVTRRQGSSCTFTTSTGT
jgi:hypothetical protein